MPRISRRNALGLFTFAASTAALTGCNSSPEAPLDTSVSRIKRTDPLPPHDSTLITAENRKVGSRDWSPDGARQAVDDLKRQIQGYASATSVHLGETIDFHVTANPAQTFRISIYRLGWYGGAGARHLLTSPQLSGRTQPVPIPHRVTGTIACRWPISWTLWVPPDWTSGLYLAVFSSAQGWRSCTPFVVRDDRHAGGLCVILPFTTFQAYNPWPLDGRTGKSLYYGYTRRPKQTDYQFRAREVSFDRPYSGNGFPPQMQRDRDFVEWVERQPYDVTYATSLDLHAGRIDPARYRGLVFSGHDEYWSKQMRQVAERMVNEGGSLAFLSANNVYWHVRIQPSSDGRPERVVACYKTDPDPHAAIGGATTKWRSIASDGRDAEQLLLGVQYNGIVDIPAPLVIKAADHWFWTGCGASDGDTIPGLVAGEADGLNSNYPKPVGMTGTVLSASPYRAHGGGQRIQNSHIYQTPQGGLVFDAGTFHWTLGLNRESLRDSRIEKATRNLFDRILASRNGKVMDQTSKG